MKIHALCVARNEADILEQTLRSAAKWCDFIYVLDNGSNDGTWEKVQALARELPCITPFMQDSRPFDDGIRGKILRRYATRANRGDWWCILDADEFYIDDPREFLERVPERYRAVWMQLYVYLFTDKDLAAYRQNPALYDDCIPIEQRLRYYVNGEHSELRFFRHSDSFKYVPGNGLHPIYPRRIRLKHFAYRSPGQIRLRLDTRREPMQRGEFLHEKRANWVFGGRIVPGPAQPEDFPQSWEERVKLSSRCHFDKLDGVYIDASSPWVPPESPAWTERIESSARSFLRRARRSWLGGRRGISRFTRAG
jgi:glycosyltransferase involved in cell wall biosynthesis